MCGCGHVFVEEERVGVGVQASPMCTEAGKKK